jgi:hypothetical protein
MGFGAMNEWISRKISSEQSERTGIQKSIFFSESNLERLTETLCKMRGAALKLVNIFHFSHPRDKFFPFKVI